jgi:hypothetical protein
MLIDPQPYFKLAEIKKLARDLFAKLSMQNSFLLEASESVCENSKSCLKKKSNDKILTKYIIFTYSAAILYIIATLDV